jgi:exodeoxyribonuclease V gamma subunit
LQAQKQDDSLLNLYPANRLENLVILLNHVLSLPKDNILSQDLILTQSMGMQHWLNLQLAKQSGISMGVNFMMPGQFFWQQIRAILGSETVPEQSPYAREVLCWRIYQLLASPQVIESEQFKEATGYWLKQGKSDDLKRFQLACQQADLYEQYLIYRPDWISNWQQTTAQPDTNWQASLWQLLTAEHQDHLVDLMEQAIVSLSQHHTHLPERICIFGINAMPPLWLNFLAQLAKYTEVHLFHLNPCVEYWGDLPSDKQLAKWLALNNEEAILGQAITNPLLANLGAQGKEFLSLLPEQSLTEIPLYQSPLPAEGAQQNKVLHHVQQDILALRDARIEQKQPLIDDSIIVTSAHSHLREVQALHDYLLHQFNADPQLTPKDVLVMCPQVEDYAPYVDAVFCRGWEDLNESLPPLPCSIADRTLKNSEPLVEAFEQLLSLPDSRFQLSQIISYLKLPAIAEKFTISEEQVLIIESWLQRAAVHWGIDSSHQAELLELSENTAQHFNWHQGLTRLLLGFAYGDQESIYQQQLLLPDVEGDEGELLGKLMLLLEQMACYAEQTQRVTV